MLPTFPLLENYLSYMEAALGRSENTVKEYRYDLILFARFLKLDRGMVPNDTPLEEIDISDIDAKILNKVTTDDLLAFVIWLSRSRKQSNASRARHIASLKSFFKYLHSKKRLIDNNPAYDIETPKIGKRMPKYLTLEQSLEIIAEVEPERAFLTHICHDLDHATLVAELDGMGLEHVRPAHDGLEIEI